MNARVIKLLSFGLVAFVMMGPAVQAMLHMSDVDSVESSDEKEGKRELPKITKIPSKPDELFKCEDDLDSPEDIDISVKGPDVVKPLSSIKLAPVAKGVPVKREVNPNQIKSESMSSSSNEDNLTIPFPNTYAPEKPSGFSLREEKMRAQSADGGGLKIIGRRQARVIKKDCPREKTLDEAQPIGSVLIVPMLGNVLEDSE